MFLRSQDAAHYSETAKALARGALDDAQLSAADRVMLEYAERLTRTPAAISNRDIAGLLDAGFSDEQVWEITFTTSVFALFNRMADAFGLQPTPGMVAALEQR